MQVLAKLITQLFSPIESDRKLHIYKGSLKAIRSDSRHTGFEGGDRKKVKTVHCIVLPGTTMKGIQSIKIFLASERA